MKNTTKKIALWLLATSTIFALWMTNTSAMWQWGWQGLGKYVTAEEKAKLQSLPDAERQAYAQELREKYGLTQGQGKWNGQWQGKGQAKQSGHNEDPAAMIADIPMSDINETEKEILINQYGEERMARDLYAYAAEKYPNVNTFGNITKSEQKHMDTLQVLLDRYDVDAPSDYAKDNDLYVTLKNKIDLSEKDAIEVGLMIEMVDIDNIADDIRNTDNDDFKVILTNIWGASYNHLRGFVNALSKAGYTTDLEWTNYITEEEANTKGGALKAKLAEKMEAEWISLPEQVSSATIKEKCANKWTDGSHRSHGDMSSSKGQWKGQMGQAMKNMSQNTKRYVNQAKVQKYKALVEDKYAAKLDWYSQEKLELINEKIDPLIEKIANSTSYSGTKKETYINLLLALKASIIDRLDTDTDMIDDLMQ